jgi:hypothetical protein
MKKIKGVLELLAKREMYFHIVSNELAVSILMSIYTFYAICHTYCK